MNPRLLLRSTRPFIILFLVAVTGCAPIEETPASQAPVKDPWQAAAERGVLFRAIGQEPGWELELDNSSIRLRYDYGSQELQLPAPRPQKSGSTTTYEVPGESHRLRVTVEDRMCADTMSGEEFPAAVTVNVEDRTLKGCGRSLASSPAR